MMNEVFLSGIAAAASILFAIRINRYTSIAETIVCLLMPVIVGFIAWRTWSQWQSAPPNLAGGGYPYSVEFVSWCIAGVMTLVALGRRVHWLRHHRHTGWTGWS